MEMEEKRSEHMEEVVQSTAAVSAGAPHPVSPVSSSMCAESLQSPSRVTTPAIPQTSQYAQETSYGSLRSRIDL